MIARKAQHPHTSVDALLKNATYTAWEQEGVLMCKVKRFTRRFCYIRLSQSFLDDNPAIYGAINDLIVGRDAQDFSWTTSTVLERLHYGQFGGLVTEAMGNGGVFSRLPADVQLFPDLPGNSTKEREEMDHDKLYKVTIPQTDDRPEKIAYGKKIGEGADGRIVLHVDGEYRDFDPTKVEEVFPFTFTVKYYMGNSHLLEAEFRGKAGSVKVGDLLVYKSADHAGRLCVVTAIGTKSRGATEWFTGDRVPVETLPAKPVTTPDKSEA